MQMDAQYTDMQKRLQKVLAHLVSEDDLILAPDDLRFFAQDVYFEGRLPLAVLRAHHTTPLAEAMAALYHAGIPVTARGSGLSYSSGYVSSQTHMLLIDLTRLDGIENIDLAASKVTVHAGCTWDSLYQALTPLGLRTPFWGPSSGLHATIGGTLSQDAVLFGSGHFGAAGLNTLGMNVILPDGTERRLTRADDPALFSAFIGDSGALGIKTKITLPLVPAHGALDFAALTFHAQEDALAAMKEIGKKGLASECFLYDQTFRTRLKGLPEPDSANTVEPVPGHRYPAHATLELHAAIEGKNAEDCEQLRASLVASAVRLGGQINGKGVLSAFRANPFTPPALMIGPQGRRWLPTNFVVEHEQVPSLFDAIRNAFKNCRSDIAQHDITWSWSALCVGRNHILLEPSLYWKDELTPISRHYLDGDMLDKLPAYPADPAARAAIGNLRSALIAAGEQVHARHIQLGRLYPAKSSYSPKDPSEFHNLKRQLDPKGLMNPGA